MEIGHIEKIEESSREEWGKAIVLVPKLEDSKGHENNSAATAQRKEDVAALQACQKNLQTWSEELGKLSKEAVTELAAAEDGERTAIPEKKVEAAARVTAAREKKMRSENLKSDLDARRILLRDFPDVSSAYRDQRKSYYHEAGQWGRHFSTVRMTVLTFTMTTCAALIAWMWQSRIPGSAGPRVLQTGLVWLVGGLWVIGVLVFWVFTYQTYKQVGTQKALRDRMPDGLHPTNTTAGDASLDWASFSVPLLSVGLWALARQSRLVASDKWDEVRWGYIGLGVLMPLAIWLALRRSNGRKVNKWPLWAVLLMVLVPLAFWVHRNWNLLR